MKPSRRAQWLLVWAVFSGAQAQDGAADVPPVATVLSVQGLVQGRRADGTPLAILSSPGSLGRSLIEQNSYVSVGPGGFATLRLSDGSVLRIEADSEVLLRGLPSQPGEATRVDLMRGRVDAVVQPQRGNRFEVHTTMAFAGVRGTKFGVTLDDRGVFASDVQEGRVAVSSMAGSRIEMVSAGKGISVDSQGRLGVLATVLRPVPQAQAMVVRDAKKIALSYGPVPGAQAYQVQIATDKDFVDVVRNAVFPRPLAEFAGLPDGSYHVSVRPVSSTGLRGVEIRHPMWVLTGDGGAKHGPPVVWLVQWARDPAFKEIVSEEISGQAHGHDPAPGLYMRRIGLPGRANTSAAL